MIYLGIIEILIIVILTGIIFAQLVVFKDQNDKLQNKILSLIDGNSYRKYKELEVKNIQNQTKLFEAREKLAKKLPFQEYDNV